MSHRDGYQIHLYPIIAGRISDNRNSSYKKQYAHLLLRDASQDSLPRKSS
jgi:hypothetical protein